MNRHADEDWGITTLPDGSFRVQVEVGSRHSGRRRAGKRFPPGTPKKVLRGWRGRALTRLEGTVPLTTRAAADSLSADIRTYLRDAPISKKTQKVRTQQLAWWAAQDARVGRPVLTPEQVRDGDSGPVGHRLGEQSRPRLDPKRLRECLAVAFAPSDPATDPTEHASTSNSYRTALFHLSTVLDQDDATAPPNPLARVTVRPPAAAQLAGQDMRVVAEILKHTRADCGRDGTVTRLRLAVLAWVHITPEQLRLLDPARDFHDVADATRDEIRDGVITVTKRPRRKGRAHTRLPPPETIPLNPWGVAAMRAFASEPRAWGPKMSASPLNKVVKRAAAAAQAALKDQGVTVDLSGFTLYHLKHSLATAAAIASGGVMNRAGVIKLDPGLVRSLDHTHQRTTQIYTQAAVDPLVRQVNAATTVYLEQLLTTPLPRAQTLRLVPSDRVVGG